MQRHNLLNHHKVKTAQVQLNLIIELATVSIIYVPKIVKNQNNHTNVMTRKLLAFLWARCSCSQMDYFLSFSHFPFYRYIQGAPIENKPLEKNAVFQPQQYRFQPNFPILYVSIHTIYPVNFIKITDIVPQVQQFKVQFFKCTCSCTFNMHA